MFNKKIIPEDDLRTAGGSQLPGLSPRRMRHFGIILAVYCVFSLAWAAFQVLAGGEGQHSLFQPAAVLIGTSVYTLLKVWHPVRWYRSGIISFLLIALDIAVCAFLLITTGGLDSAYLLYTLSPILRSGLFLDSTITFIVTMVSVASVVCIQLFNPVFHQAGRTSWDFLIVFITASCLAAILPYIININLRQRLLAEDIIAERKRLSREIHDGTVQVLSALRWHAELLDRRLSRMGLNIEESHQMLALTEKYRQDAQMNLELLRSDRQDADIVSRIRESLKVLAPEVSTDLRVEAESVHLEQAAEHELLRVCQEAITNIKKHSRARHARVEIKAINSHLEVTIADDGSGFDAVSFYQDGFQARGHGLAVMKERCELIGGKFRVLSFPGKGTEVQLEIPVENRFN